MSVCMSVNSCSQKQHIRFFWNFIFSFLEEKNNFPQNRDFLAVAKNLIH